MSDPVAEPPPDDRRPSAFAPGAARLLPPGLRAPLSLAAGALVALWLVIQLYGAGGLLALVAGVVSARLTYRRRRSLNVAFAAGLVVFLVALLLWGSLLQARWDEATATPTPPAAIGP